MLPVTIGTAFWQGLATMQALSESTPKHRHRPHHRIFSAAVRVTEKNIDRYRSAPIVFKVKHLRAKRPGFTGLEGKYFHVPVLYDGYYFK